MIVENYSIEKKIPKTVPVPFGLFDKFLIDDAQNCDCYKNDCDCYGKPTCDCCYPDCACAPSMISPTETEIIITFKKRKVPQSYIETYTRDMPSYHMVNFTIDDFIIVEKYVTREVPYLKRVTDTYDEVEIYYQNTMEEVPEKVTIMKWINSPIEVEVVKERKIPMFVMKEVEIVVPVERDQEIIQKKSVLEDVLIETPVAVEFDEIIPS